MIQEYFHITDGSEDETEELEKLASQLSISETPQQVCVHSYSHFKLESLQIPLIMSQYSYTGAAVEV